MLSGKILPSRAVLSKLDLSVWRMPVVDLEVLKTVPDLIGAEGVTSYQKASACLRRHRRILRIENEIIHHHNLYTAPITRFKGTISRFRLLSLDNYEPYLTSFHQLQRKFYDAVDAFAGPRSSPFALRPILEKNKIPWPERIHFAAKIHFRPVGGSLPEWMPPEFQVDYYAELEDLLGLVMEHWIGLLRGMMIQFSRPKYFTRFGLESRQLCAWIPLGARVHKDLQEKFPIIRKSNVGDDPRIEKIFDKVERTIFRMKPPTKESVWDFLAEEAAEIVRMIDEIPWRCGRVAKG